MTRHCGVLFSSKEEAIANLEARAPSPSPEMQAEAQATLLRCREQEAVTRALDALAPALDATKSCTDGCDHEGVEWHYSTVDDFATALRAALIEQAKGAEPRRFETFTAGDGEVSIRQAKGAER
jgi:hypothetical protein